MIEEAAGGSPSDAAARSVSLEQARRAAEASLEVYQYRKAVDAPPKVSALLEAHCVAEQAVCRRLSLHSGSGPPAAADFPAASVCAASLTSITAIHSSPQDAVACLARKFEALARELAEVTEEEFQRLMVRDASSAAMVPPTDAVERLMREVQHQHTLQQQAAQPRAPEEEAPPAAPPSPPPGAVQQNIVPLPLGIRRQLERERVSPEGTGEEVLLQGFNWDRCGAGGHARLACSWLCAWQDVLPSADGWCDFRSRRCPPSAAAAGSTRTAGTTTCKPAPPSLGRWASQPSGCRPPPSPSARRCALPVC